MTDAIVSDVRSTPVPATEWKQRYLPVVDYNRHPAYGRMLERGDVLLRLRALTRFARSLCYVVVRRLIDYETLPLLSKDRNRGGKLKFAARYVSMMAGTHGRRLLQAMAGKRSAAPADSRLFGLFANDGFLLVKFNPEKVERLRTLSAGYFDELRKSRAAIPLAERKFDDNMRWVSRGEDANIYRQVEMMLAEAGMLEVVSAYLKRPVGVKHVVPQLNDDADVFWKRQFPDMATADPKTTFMHVDTTYSLCKFMFYLTPIEAVEDGPFAYVRGTNNVKSGPFEGLIRRANEYASLSSKRPDMRRLFYALPRALRKKCDFGNDMLDTQPESAELLADEVQFFTRDCGGILFDPSGVHRGGMVAKGERCVITALITET